MLPAELLIATSNPGKLKEFKEMLPPGVVLHSLGTHPVKLPEEVGSTFEENAIQKASVAAAATGLTTLADDSGLEVDFLEGRPGIHSARFAGESANSDDNIKLLLQLLDGVAAEHRRARFVCALAVAEADGSYQCFRGECEGAIAFNASGERGFGYDPVFLVNEERTFADLSDSEKNVVSHRGKAVQRWLSTLKTTTASAEQSN